MDSSNEEDLESNGAKSRSSGKLLSSHPDSFRRSSSKRSSGKANKGDGGELEEQTAAVHMAVWPMNAKENEFRSLLEEHPKVLNRKYGQNEDTLLHRAARHGKTAIVRVLLEKKANLNAQNSCGRTALHIAAHTLREEIVQLLLEAGADVDFGDVDGDAPIHLACKSGSLPILKLILEKSLCKYGCEGHLGNSLLHYAARFGHLEMTEYLIGEGNDVNARNHLTETPLHLASGVHKPMMGSKILELLLDNGADLCATTAFGDTAAHYAALGGTTVNLMFLIDKGVSMMKAKHCEKRADEICQKYNLPEETCSIMKMSFLQKLAKGACINKAMYVIDCIMKARFIMAKNQEIGIQENDSYIVVHQELSNQQREFKRMAEEMTRDMHSPNSAMKLFLKNSPDTVEYLLNKCVLAFCKDQIQGKVFFDFFLFYPPQVCAPTSHEIGELTLMETLIESRKERFLTHPVFETFLKLKWYRTWKLYLLILLVYAIFVVSLLGYSLTHFGNVLDAPLDPTKTNGWWYFLAVTTCYTALVEVCKAHYFLSHCFRHPGEHLSRMKRDPWLAIHLVLSKSKDAAIPILAALVLTTDLDPETRRYLAAVAVVMSCFSFMLALSRLPKIGIYIFMLNKVFSTIFNFFVSYFWHFLGYAVAFHIIMSKDDVHGPFGSLGNSIIKVLTMLMGEYDFADTFATPETYWLSKAIFVLFVIDMSVVLMNLVLGLAVNDVDSILQDSRVRSMVHETITVTYLEELCVGLSKLPLIGRYCVPKRLVNSNTCQFKEIVYLNLIDTVNNESNELVIDRTPMGGVLKAHPCPATVTSAVVAILTERQIQPSSLPDRRTQTIIKELKEQNSQLQQKMERMEDRLETLIGLVHDVHTKIASGQAVEGDAATSEHESLNM